MEKLKIILKKVNWRLLGRIGYWLLVSFLILVAGLTAASALNFPKGIKLYIVQSGSMAPKIPLGSVVVVNSQDEYEAGNIITFKTEGERNIVRPKYTTTHRIIEIRREGDEVLYLTKGDANDAPDARLVEKDLVLGKVIFPIPFLGYPVSFARTLPGLIILIVIPATIIVYSEILNIKKEVVKIFRERKKPFSAKATKGK